MGDYIHDSTPVLLERLADLAALPAKWEAEDGVPYEPTAFEEAMERRIRAELTRRERCSWH